MEKITNFKAYKVIFKKNFSEYIAHCGFKEADAREYYARHKALIAKIKKREKARSEKKARVSDHKKVGTKFIRAYGLTLLQLAKKLEVSRSSLSAWHRSGFDVFEQAKRYNSLKTRNGKAYLTQLWKNMKQRCGNPKDKKYRYYGGKGIKVKMTYADLVSLWRRCNGYRLKRPSIDRKNSNGHYTLENCRFIEFRKNCSRKNNCCKKKKSMA